MNPTLGFPPLPTKPRQGSSFPLRRRRDCMSVQKPKSVSLLFSGGGGGMDFWGRLPALSLGVLEWKKGGDGGWVDNNNHCTAAYSVCEKEQQTLTIVSLLVPAPTTMWYIQQAQSRKKHSLQMPPVCRFPQKKTENFKQVRSTPVICSHFPRSNHLRKWQAPFPVYSIRKLATSTVFAHFFKVFFLAREKLQSADYHVFHNERVCNAAFGKRRLRLLFLRLE